MHRITLLTLSAGCVAILGGLAGSESLSAQTMPQPSQLPPGAQAEIALVRARIDRIEASALSAWRSGTNPDPYTQINLLGKLLIFDRQLSVNRDEACSFCHMPETGFTGPVASLNMTTVAYPGSVTTRFSNRKPQSYGYATFAPILHYNQNQQNFYGGNFWDMRATGLRLGNPAAEQAQGPPVNPVEMGFTDPACLVYRVSQAPYRPLFESVWGKQAFVISWPADIERVCSTPGTNYDPNNPTVKLSDIDRGNVSRTFDQFAQGIAQYEMSINNFTSKFDYYLAGQANLTANEKAGYDLFRGKGNCNSCHLDGTPNGPQTPLPQAPSGVAPGTVDVATSFEPLFTDFTSSNLGLPRNLALPYYYETSPDQYGYAANPSGLNAIDYGVGGFLSGPNNPNSQWAKLATSFNGFFQVPTLRNVDMRPNPKFPKAYMHNGYLKSLKEVVHFYNTRDKYGVTGPCPAGKIEKVNCWPTPEIPGTKDRTIGSLGLTDLEEDQIVAFLESLTDGYSPQTGTVQVPQE